MLCVDAYLGFVVLGPVDGQYNGLLDGLGVDHCPRGDLATDASYTASVPGVFVASHTRRGQSLIA